MKRSTFFTGFKFVAKTVVGFGVSSIVKNTIDSTTPVDTKGLKKTTIGIGAFVISMYVVDKIGEYVEENLNRYNEKAEDIITGIMDELEEMELEEEASHLSIIKSKTTPHRGPYAKPTKEEGETNDEKE